MKLTRVTITGADDATHPQDLLNLSQEYPFVEWGILIDQHGGDKPRYPSESWIGSFMQVASANNMKVALHVCGRYVQSLINGKNEIPNKYTEWPQRIQLNFHAQPHRSFLMDFLSALEQWDNKTLIFQIDGADGTRLFGQVYPQKHNAVPLFDLSHGGGVLPEEWPMPYKTMRAHGYAGGLSASNLQDQLPKIAASAGPRDFWVDMETRVRSYVPVEGGRRDRLDLNLVAKVLEIARPHIVTRL